MPLIVDRATSYEETAQRLHQSGEFHTSDIMRGYAEEEAAKVLVLIDYIRCPNNSGQGGQVLDRFYDHVAKRIHAMACEPNIASFGELSDLVDNESRSWYLDGPNGVDWIFPNAISTAREQELYVDYMPNMTDAAGSHHWITPAPPVSGLFPYQPSNCVRLVRCLLEVGALSTGGLAEIARVWRGFMPTDREALHYLIVETLKGLAQRSSSIEDEEKEFIVLHWSFPLWPLTLRRSNRNNDDLDDLREVRKRTIERIEDTEARRDPPPAISRSKVEEMSEAYFDWRVEAEARATSGDGTGDSSLRVQSDTDIQAELDLASYTRIRQKLTKLSDKERGALVALVWFTRDRIADWPRTYAQALDVMPSLGEAYQIGLGRDWLAGFRRWESKPSPFSAGQWYRADYS